MKVEKPGFTEFSNIMPGQVFEHDFKIYMRVRQCTVLDCDGKEEIICNAIDLNFGDMNIFDDDEKVMLYKNARVVIE